MWQFNNSSLPYAKGPYIPGCTDIMTDYSKDGTFFRLYYPTDLKAPIQDYSNDWLAWIPHNSYLRGFARVLMTWLWLVRFVFWWVSGNIQIPVVYGARIKKDKKLKCVIFSHGLGAARFLYSTMCIELASRGFVVAVIEHRDQSACNTYYYKSVEDVKKNKKTFIHYVPVKLGPNHFTVRQKQVQQRADQCTNLIQIIKKINSGNSPINILKDLSSEKNNRFSLNDLKDLIDVDDLSMMGHSFGGATALLTIYKNKDIRRGIILDPWMFSIKDMTEIAEISQPLIFINTQTFHIETNVKIMDLFIQDREKNRHVYTILHTTHENQTDTVFVAGYWLNWFMKKLTAENAININNYLILDFLNKYSDINLDFCECEKYLLQESENYVSGIDGLKKIIEVKYNSIFKMFN